MRPSPILAQLCYKEPRCRADLAEGSSQSRLGCVSLFGGFYVQFAQPGTCNSRCESRNLIHRDPLLRKSRDHDSSDDELESNNCHLNQIPD
jgi:hypothetical protein